MSKVINYERERKHSLKRHTSTYVEYIQRIRDPHMRKSPKIEFKLRCENCGDRATTIINKKRLCSACSD